MSYNKASFFKFCPNCGNQNLTFTNNFKLHCNECDFVLYHNIAAAVAIIFTFQNKILFTVRNVNPDAGKLDLPGGFIDPNENAEEAACREIQEELGMTISPSHLKYITTAPNNYLYKNIPYRTMDIFYEYPLKSDKINIASKEEIKDLIWIDLNNINFDAIGFVSVRKVVRDYYSQ